MPSINLLALVFFISLSANALAKDKSIFILANSNTKHHNTITQNIINNFADSDIRIKTSNNPETIGNYEHDLIITIGSKIAKQTLESTTTVTPVLSLLLPETVIDQISNKNNRPWSTQIIDQPLERQLLLVKHLLGKNSKVGVILGPTSIKNKSKIELAEKSTGMVINYREIKSPDELIPVLKEIITQNDILLAIPDPMVYSKRTIRGILLLTYRNKTPVIGFSKSYIKAGATAGIYSTTRQIAADATENIKNFFEMNKKFSSNTYYPQQFSVDINKRVARAMKLKIDSQDALSDLIKRK
ncbi:MAG: hypothetical protein OQK47_11195 [Gammaproteobacteria bacterium]|nr:hypothetical protein [Gammaproteobacteria bacterium]